MPFRSSMSAHRHGSAWSGGFSPGCRSPGLAGPCVCVAGLVLGGGIAMALAFFSGVPGRSLCRGRSLARKQLAPQYQRSAIGVALVRPRSGPNHRALPAAFARAWSICAYAAFRQRRKPIELADPRLLSSGWRPSWQLAQVRGAPHCHRHGLSGRRLCGHPQQGDYIVAVKWWMALGLWHRGSSLPACLWRRRPMRFPLPGRKGQRSCGRRRSCALPAAFRLCRSRRRCRPSESWRRSIWARICCSKRPIRWSLPPIIAIRKGVLRHVSISSTSRSTRRATFLKPAASASSSPAPPWPKCAACPIARPILSSACSRPRPIARLAARCQPGRPAQGLCGAAAIIASSSSAVLSLRVSFEAISRCASTI